MCVRGASAFGEAIRDLDPEGIRIAGLVVWEPVIKTDTSFPRPEVQALLTRPRTIQFWDPTLALSREIVRAASLADADSSAFPPISNLQAGQVVWDVVALFEANQLWQEVFPRPAVTGFPVVDAIVRVRKRLVRLL